MEKELNFFPVLPLNEMALTRAVLNLYGSDIAAAVGKEIKLPDTCPRREVLVHWESIVAGVEEKVSSLAVPESLKKIMVNLVPHFRAEVRKWTSFFIEDLYNSPEDIDMRVFEQLCWTSAGEVDYEKTAERLVRFEEFDCTKRFRLACFYCLEDHIPLLWEELPKGRRNDINQTISVCTPAISKFEHYWASVLKGERLLLPSRDFFKSAALTGCKAALKYFFPKLTDEEREGALLSALHIICVRCLSPAFDVACYLLSLLTHEKRIQFFKERPCNICFLQIFFLRWPGQDFFLDIADLIWSFLPTCRYAEVLDDLHDIICDPEEGYYIPDPFQKFFVRSPRDFRRSYVEFECRNYGRHPIFYEFCRREDTETMQVVLRSLDPGDRAELLSHDRFCFLYSLLISKGKWHLVEVCVRELSEEGRELLKKSIIERKFAMRRSKRMFSKDMLERFLDLLSVGGASGPSAKKARR